MLDRTQGRWLYLKVQTGSEQVYRRCTRDRAALVHLEPMHTGAPRTGVYRRRTPSRDSTRGHVEVTHTRLSHGGAVGFRDSRTAVSHTTLGITSNALHTAHRSHCTVGATSNGLQHVHSLAGEVGPPRDAQQAEQRHVVRETWQQAGGLAGHPSISDAAAVTATAEAVT